MGENEYGQSDHLPSFHLFEALNDAVRMQFQGLIFYTLSKAVFIIFPNLETRFNTHYQNA